MSRKGRYGFVKPHLTALFALVDGLGAIVTVLLRALRPTVSPATPRRILLINLAHIGDVLMISPAIRAVRAAYPDAHITVLVGPWSKDLLAANPYLDEVLVFEPSWWNRESGGYLRPAEFRAFVRLLRRGKYDISINFKSFFQENLALWLARIPTRVGYGIYGGRFLLTHLAEYDWTMHTVELNMALIDRLLGKDKTGLGMPANPVQVARQGGFPQRSIRLWRREPQAAIRPRAARISGMPELQVNQRNIPEMYVFQEDMAAAEEFCSISQVTPSGRGFPAQASSPWVSVEIQGSRLQPDAAPPLVAFHIGAGYPSKLWDAESYAKLADELHAKWGARIVAVGGKGDLPLISTMQQCASVPIVIAAGKLNIRQTAALISLCDLFVGNDSGPAHIATAVGVPTVAIFSGENEAAVWRPYAEKCVVAQHQPNCSPCGRKSCNRDHACMSSITVEEILAGIERVLGLTCPL